MGAGGANPGLLGGSSAPGGKVIEPSCGFSISIMVPHLAHLVFARGRSPSLLSSNLYLAWQLVQTMIIRTSFRRHPGGGRPDRKPKHSKRWHHSDAQVRLEWRERPTPVSGH